MQMNEVSFTVVRILLFSFPFLLANCHESFDIIKYVGWCIWRCVSSLRLSLVIYQHLFEIPVDVVVSNRRPADVTQVIYEPVWSWTSGLHQNNNNNTSAYAQVWDDYTILIDCKIIVFFFLYIAGRKVRSAERYVDPRVRASHVFTLAPDLSFEDRAHSYDRPTQNKYDCFTVYDTSCKPTQ